MCIQNLQLCNNYLQNTVTKRSNTSPAIIKSIKDFGVMINNPNANAPQAHEFLDKNIKWPLLAEMMKTHKVNFITGDITEQTTDAIVNAANSELKVIDMWWVAWAMGKKWWNKLEQDCQHISQWRQMEKWKVFTTNSRKSHQKILHGVTMDLWWTVSPETVRKVTRNLIDEAKKQWCKSITLPLFGSGIGGLTTEQSKLAIQQWLYDKIWDLDEFEKIHIIDYKPNNISFNTHEATMKMAA